MLCKCAGQAGAPQQQSVMTVGPAAQAGGPRGVTLGQPPQGMLTLQEDEVDWGSEASDPALLHALAVIKAKGETGPLALAEEHMNAWAVS